MARRGSSRRGAIRLSLKRKRSATASSKPSPKAAKANAPPVPKRSTIRKPERRPTVSFLKRAKRTRPTKRSPHATAHPPEAPRPAPVVQPVPMPQDTVLTRSVPASAPPSPAASAASVEEQFSIPSGYGHDRIVLMVKDPWWVFAYWEVQSSTERAARAQLLPDEVAGLKTVLRVYDVTDVDVPVQPAARSFDIVLSGLASNWYIHTDAPNHAFIAELGLLTAGGRFLPLVRSNRVRTPRFGPSEIIDEAWMTTDELYWKLFGAAGIGIGASESGRAALMAQPSGQWSSSGFLTPARQPAVRGFWLRMDAELIIHGATEPRASVAVQGQPVPVRRDGSFSLRLAMPEGSQTLTVEVVSADGTRSKTVTPVVSLSGVRSAVPTGPQVAPQQAS